MIKLTFLLFFLFNSCYVFSQVVDARLLKNKGEKINETHKLNRNSYNYFLFELDSSYFVNEISNLTKSEKKLIRKDIQLSAETQNQINTSNFNFVELGIQLSKKNRQYIKLNKNQVLVFYTVAEVTQKFTKSPLNSK